MIEGSGIRTLTRRIFSDESVGAVQTTLNYLGFEAPNVFNETDLSMGDRWLEISVKTPTGQ